MNIAWSNTSTFNRFYLICLQRRRVTSLVRSGARRWFTTTTRCIARTNRSTRTRTNWPSGSWRGCRMEPSSGSIARTPMTSSKSKWWEICRLRARMHQRKLCDNVVMMLEILFSLKTMESLGNGLQPHCGVTPLSMGTELLESSQKCRGA